ncbi:phytanoyl-CoA dioxygenase family protein [Paenibacillus sambharensis]|uniref:Phytanoyl-CoA dioxygenase family protein n=1 Tax=Paenibacillus sambharensis TaxID=1803190 RepID=A0A2W1LDU4_9BACL|nr:phytanoyl-CoA dioxygenase family protein [Paenibacillus sambharensis]PZD96819.1 phytanoyl-CoA dioxygenase family protein [Paenibacillus sambharensis]
MHDSPLSDPFPLGTEQVSDYQEQGHLYVPGVISAEAVRTFRSRIYALVERLGRGVLHSYIRDDFGGKFLELTNVWRLDPELRELTFARRFARMAAELLQVPSVRLHYDCILFKEEGGGPTPWHQDQLAWPLDTEHTITMWMPLSDIPSEIGSLSFLTGSHRLGKASMLDAVRQNLPEVSYGAMKAGDATFHSGWTFHAAKGNPMKRTRDVFAIVYYADGAVLTAPGTEAYRQEHLNKFFPGQKPGEAAASELNPLLWDNQP